MSIGHQPNYNSGSVKREAKEDDQITFILKLAR